MTIKKKPVKKAPASKIREGDIFFCKKMNASLRINWVKRGEVGFTWKDGPGEGFGNVMKQSELLNPRLYKKR